MGNVKFPTSEMQEITLARVKEYPVICQPNMFRHNQSVLDNDCPKTVKQCESVNRLEDATSRHADSFHKKKFQLYIAWTKLQIWIIEMKRHEAVYSSTYTRKTGRRKGDVWD